MDSNKDLLRGDRLTGMDDLALRLTSSVQSDPKIAKAIVLINLAHVSLLERSGAIDRETRAIISEALSKAYNGYRIDYRLEDVHMNLEMAVKESVGEKAGFLGLGKSRNDQVVTAIRMVVKEELLETARELGSLISSLLDTSALNKNTFMIGMTHLQPAQPSTVAHWLLCYTGALLRDLRRLREAYHSSDASPMGAAALAGSTVYIDRAAEALMLGFSGLVENTMDSVSSRDFIADALYALASTAVDISRVASDVMYLSSTGLIRIADEYVSTSSIMPQKRNAVVAEIIRAKTAIIMSNLESSMEIMRGLNQTYNLDLQEITPRLWASMEEIKPIIKVVGPMIASIKYDEAAMISAASTSQVTASDVAEWLSTRYGIPFRSAHQLVGKAIRETEDGGLGLQGLVVKYSKQDLGLDIDAVELAKRFDVVESIKLRLTEGGPNPMESDNIIRKNRQTLLEEGAWVKVESDRIKKAYQSLLGESLRDKEV